MRDSLVLCSSGPVHRQPGVPCLESPVGLCCWPVACVCSDAAAAVPGARPGGAAQGTFEPAGGALHPPAQHAGGCVCMSACVCVTINGTSYLT